VSGETIFNESVRRDAAQTRAVTSNLPGPVADFPPAHAVDKLLAFGCAGRGRHCLFDSAGDDGGRFAGRRTDPDYYDLQRLFDGDCCSPHAAGGAALPLLARPAWRKRRSGRGCISPFARSCLRVWPSVKAQTLLRAWKEDPEIALFAAIAHGKREFHGKARRFADYGDVSPPLFPRT